MSRVLLTAPFVGEIGWELMSWQAHVRQAYARGRYDRVVVLGGAGKAGFYRELPLEYRTVDLSGMPGTAYEDRRVIVDPWQVVSSDVVRACVEPIVERRRETLLQQGATVDVIWPGYAGRHLPCDRRYQRFVRFESTAVSRSDQPWVVLVPRSRSYRAGQNWPESKWQELQRLLGERGVHTTVYPCDAEAAIAMLSGCDLAVGQSTGGLHLASLCGCPRMVWSLENYLVGECEITNRQRYETWWNPLAAPAIVHETPSLPSPEQAAEQTLAALASIGRRTGSRLQHGLFRVKWAVRRLLNRHVIEPRRYARWPWAVQRFVRYELA